MANRAATLCLLSLLICAPAFAEEAEQRMNFLVLGGIGLPQLLHAEVGVYPLPRLSSELLWGNILFNTMVGAGVTYAFLGEAVDRPPRHALLVSTRWMVNPTLGSLRLESSGDVLAATAGFYAGYGFTSDLGFTARVLGGALIYADDGPAAGPDALVSVGWTF